MTADGREVYHPCVPDPLPPPPEHVAHVLQAPPTAVVALNLQMRNSAVSELTFTPSRHWLVSFNGLPHLDDAERAGWITHS